MKKYNIYETQHTQAIILNYYWILSPKPHLHQEIEMILVIDGDTEAFSDKRKEHLRKGDLFISFPNQIHYYENCSPGEYLIMILSPYIFYNTNAVFNDMIPKQNVINQISPELQQLFCSAASTTGPYQDTIKTGLLNQAIASVLSDLDLTIKKKTSNSSLVEVLDYCSANFASYITLDVLSEKLHISKYHISHLLNDKLGMSFNDYINMLRIKNASDLIRKTDKNMTKISEETGFGSIRSFNRAFQKNMNMSPLEYRTHFQQRAVVK